MGSQQNRGVPLALNLCGLLAALFSLSEPRGSSPSSRGTGQLPGEQDLPCRLAGLLVRALCALSGGIHPRVWARV